jgi:hypothetical protein
MQVQPSFTQQSTCIRSTCSPASVNCRCLCPLCQISCRKSYRRTVRGSLALSSFLIPAFRVAAWGEGHRTVVTHATYSKTAGTRGKVSDEERKPSSSQSIKVLSAQKVRQFSWSALRCCLVQPVDGSRAAIPRPKSKLYDRPLLTRCAWRGERTK